MIENIMELIKLFEENGYLVIDIKQLSEDIVYDLYQRNAIRDKKVDGFDVDMMTLNYDVEPLKDALIRAVYKELDNQNIEIL